MSNIEKKYEQAFSFAKTDDFEKISSIGYALSSVDRVRILNALTRQPKNISTLSAELQIPITTLTRYLHDMEEANLLQVNYQPSFKGKMKYFSLTFNSRNLSAKAAVEKETPSRKYVVEMPVGMFSSCDIEGPCGMNTSYMPLEWISTPESFWHPQRMDAELLWFYLGKIGYDFPLPNLNNQMGEKIESVTFSLEVSSEATNYNNDWPSDISVWINDKRILTFVSPADFGGTRGKYTPIYWPINNSQYGLLKQIKISNEGVFLDNILIKNNICLDDLHLENLKSLRFSIGVQKDAVHKGGINLFGKNFGDYNQAIVMTTIISNDNGTKNE